MVFYAVKLYSATILGGRFAVILGPVSPGGPAVIG